MSVLIKLITLTELVYAGPVISDSVTLKIATIGVPVAFAKCIEPESLHINALAFKKRLQSSTKFVFPERSRTFLKGTFNLISLQILESLVVPTNLNSLLGKFSINNFNRFTQFAIGHLFSGVLEEPGAKHITL